MQVLREISSQTAESTTATSTSIGKLAELAAQLRRSVSGFRLPDGAAPSALSSEYPTLRPDSPPADGSDLRRVSGLTG
jgi:twitching motility protein PilJ